MKIIFYPDNEGAALAEAVTIYQKIWDEEGQRIIAAFRRYTGLEFTESSINGIVLEAKSHSYPLSLRASYSLDTKKATLVHELGHRLLIGNNIKGQSSLESHKQLNLFLFEVWTELYGKDFALAQAAIEKSRTPMYLEAWAWSEKMTPEQRKNVFEALKSERK